MGTVYLAEHRLMERQVALKVVRSELVYNADAVARFLQEVKAAARLSHPNIAAAHDAEQAGRLCFLVMEYVEGISLDKLVEQGGSLPIAAACDAIRQAALGLQHAFEQKMVHRDVKPSNLLRTPSGQVKVLDFGLARLADDRRRTALARDLQAGARVTQFGTLLGTPDFMAPEQASNSRTADVRADVYSLGCTLYYLLSARVPFPGGSLVDKVEQHSSSQPAPLRSLRPDLPPELVAVVVRMMAKAPADRHATPAEVAVALAPFCRPAAPPPRRFTRRAVLTAAGGALLGGTALTLWLRPQGSKLAPQQTVLLVVPSKMFWYPDYLPVRTALEKSVRVQVAATQREPCVPDPGGKIGNQEPEPVKPDVLLKDAKASDYDAVVFIGGPGVREFLNGNPGCNDAHRLIREMLQARRTLGAICMAPPILAEAGAFKDQPVQRATAFPRDEIKEKLRAEGVEWVDEPVVIAGRVITAQKPRDAEDFARAILKSLKPGG
jgi:serine/threonine protein kinase/putative intracellular protease/amidase